MVWGSCALLLKLGNPENIKNETSIPMIRLSGKLTRVSASKIPSDRTYKHDFEWFSKLRAVHDFIDRKGCRPRFESDDSYERMLARWLNTQIVAYNSGSLSTNRLSEFSRVIPVDSLRKVRSFEERVGDLREFVDKFGRPPKNTKDSEKSLAQWLHVERVKYKRGLLSRRKEELLESTKFALDMRTRSETETMMNEALVWCGEHGYLPRSNIASDGVLTEGEQFESKLGQWMRNHARDGASIHESAESAFRREFIRELLTEYPTYMEYHSPRSLMETEAESFREFGSGSYSTCGYRWRTPAPEIKKLMEHLLLEDFMSEWWGRGYRLARRPNLM